MARAQRVSIARFLFNIYRALKIPFASAIKSELFIVGEKWRSNGAFDSSLIRILRRNRRKNNNLVMKMFSLANTEPPTILFAAPESALGVRRKSLAIRACWGRDKVNEQT